MAVNELDARTRAVEKMKADQGKEVEAYNAAENQLLAIRNEQKQNIAAARLEAAAAQQQNATVAQAAELVGSSSGATVQAPVNAATQGVLGKYGLRGPTVTKTASTQKSANTQQITKQNIVINNYNTTNNSTVNNTTTNVPNTGPVQGRPVVVNRDDTGRFKVWVNNVIARQNEQAAIRDREYQRRESELSRSANKMTRKLEAVSSTISRSLDPRRINNSTQSQLKTMFRLMGLGVIVAKWPVLIHTIQSIEHVISKGLKYLGLKDHENGEETGLLRDLKYIFLGKNRADNFEGGFIDLLKEFFTGDGGVIDTFKKKISLWMEYTGKAISAIRPPETSILHPVDSMKNIALYLGQVISTIFQGPGGALKNAAKVARAEGTEKMTNDSDLIHKTKAKAQGGGTISYGDAISVSSNDPDIGTYGKYKVQKEDLTAKGELVNNLGASLRQSAYIGQNLLVGTGTGVGNEEAGINVSGILEGLDRLNKTAAKNKTAIVDPKFIEALEKLGVDIKDRVKDKAKEYGYVALKKTEDEKAQEFAQNKGLANTVGAISGTAAGISATMLTTAFGNPAALATGALTAEKVNELATEWTQKLASSEYTYRLVPKGRYDEKSYLKFKDLKGADKQFETYYELSKEDMDYIKTKLGELTGRGEEFSYDATDVESTKAMANYVLKMNPKRKLDVSYTSGLQKIAEVEGEYSNYLAEQKAIDEQSMMNGALSRAGEVVNEIKGEIEEEMVDLEDDENTLDGRPGDVSTPGQTTTLASTVTPEASTAVTEQVTWDVDKAIQTVQNNAGTASKKKCLRYVANAIDSGFGVNWGINNALSAVKDSNFVGVHLSEAKNTGPQLLGLGFKKIDNNTPWQKGDIHVYQPKNKEKAGHIEIFDGTKWVSDFNQKNPGFKWGTYSAMDTYRWKGLLNGEIINNDLLIADSDEHPSDGVENDGTIENGMIAAVSSTAAAGLNGQTMPKVEGMYGMYWDPALQSYVLDDGALTTPERVEPAGIDIAGSTMTGTGLGNVAANLALTDTHLMGPSSHRDEKILNDLLAVNQLGTQVSAGIADGITVLNNNMASMMSVVAEMKGPASRRAAASFQQNDGFIS